MASSSPFSITKSEGLFVTSAEPTPSGDLPLSWIDKIYFPGLFVETIYVYKRGEEPAKVIREALSKTLVPYYPMAGRLVMGEGPDDLHVSCTGEGIWFIEALANCRLEDVDYLENHPIMIPKDHLLPFHPDPKGMIALMQVTEFTCGGFVVGFKSDHCMNDGLGVAQFMTAISDMARGLKEPRINPVWGRSALPNPPRPALGPLPPLPSYHLQDFRMDLSLDQINRLKNRFTEQTGTRCSTFEVLSAMLWQCRARAMGLAPEAEVRLVFTADIRPMLKDVLPRGGGYYGNCVFQIVAKSASGKVAHGSMCEVVGMIKAAKERIGEEVSMWAKGEPSETFKPEVMYESVHVISGLRIGFDEVDYGWGPTSHNAPLISNDLFAMCFFKQLSCERGFRLITQCVKEEHLKDFQDQMIKWAA